MSIQVQVDIVNAFVANGSGGNPAGVVLDAAVLSSTQMQLIAKRVGLSETAFVLPHKKDTYEVKFFTPTTQVDLCGHATIATWALLYQRHLVGPGEYSQLTKAGSLKIHIETNGLVSMEQAKPLTKGSVPITEIAEVLKIDSSEFGVLAPKVVSTGLATLLIELQNKDDLLTLAPDFEGMALLGEKYSFLQAHPFVLLADTETLATGRDFGPTLGVIEESATGTANGALLYYLKQSGIINEKILYRLEQGESMQQLSYIYGKVTSEVIWVGGKSKTIRQTVIDLD